MKIGRLFGLALLCLLVSTPPSHAAECIDPVPPAPEILHPSPGEVVPCSSIHDPIMVAVSWERVEEDMDPVSYDVSFDGRTVEEGTTATSAVAAADCGTSHSWTVVAKNQCGSNSSSVPFSVSSCEDEFPQWECSPPEAGFTWQPSSPEVGEEVAFTADPAYPTTAVSYTWRIDGGPEMGGSSSEQLFHTFDEPGDHAVFLEVTTEGGTDSTSRTVQVGSAAPAALDVAGPAAGETDERLTFSASATGCVPAAGGWSWSLDGGAPVGDASGAGIDVVWTTPGSKQIRVTNSACGTAVGRHGVEISAAVVPEIEISAPASAEVDRPVTLSATATGCTASAGGWSWEVGPGTIESGAGTSTVSATWSAAGTQRVEARNDACGSAVGRHTLVVSAGEGPNVTRVDRELAGYLFADTPVTDRFDVAVAWSDLPGDVRFSIDGREAATVGGDPSGASHGFSIARDFTAALEPHQVEIVAISPQGAEGEPVIEPVWVVPPPAWLALARDHVGGLFSSGVEASHVVYKLRFDFPQPHLAEDGPIRLPTFIPFIGGRFGLTETFVRLEGQLSSAGSGNLEISGQTGFAVAGGVISGEAKGDGRIAFEPRRGFVLTRAVTAIIIDGKIRRERSLLNLLPGLRKAEKLPKVGGLFRRLNRVTTVTGTFRTRLALDATFEQDDDGDLEFTEGTGRLGLGLGAEVEVDLGRLTLAVEGEIDGGGEVGVPRPLVRGLFIEGRVAASATLDLLLDVQVDGEIEFACRWPTTGSLCSDEPALTTGSLVAGDIRLRPIHHDYDSWGEASRVRRPARARATAHADRVAELVDNVFPGASPTLLDAGGGELLLWQHQDPVQPVHRSLDVAWSADRGDGWSDAALIADDDRLDVAPVSAADGRGRAVAAWLRSGDGASAAPPATLPEAADFYRSLEVVTATYDPGSATWDEITPLTDDRALDSDLRLAGDGNGRVLLTWLSNAGGEMLSTEDSPTDVRSSSWDAETARWRPAATIAGGRVGVVRHAADVHGDDAVVVVEREIGDGAGRLDLYRREGGSWSGPGTVPGAGTDDWGAAVRFDAEGTWHLAWVRDGELVHLREGTSEPRPVAAGNPGLGLADPLLLAGPRGHLALLWTATGETGTADPFVAVFDGDHGAWSTARPLAALDGMVRGMGGFFAADGTLHLAVAVTGPGADSGSGRTDLLRIEHRPGRDLALGEAGLTLQPPDPEPGELVRATVELRNAGDLAVAGAVAELRSRLEGGGSQVEASAEIGDLLPGGASVPLSFEIARPPDARDLEVVVDPGDRVAESDETNNRISAGLANRAPVPVIDADRVSGTAPLTVTFDASASHDPDGQALQVRWSFGDGSAGAGGARVQHTYRSAGIYRATVLVSDGALSRSAEVEVSVEGAADPCGSDRILCLDGGRFEVTGDWETGDGNRGAARVRPLTGDTGYLWFFDRDNVEVLVKVLDGCSVNGRYWVFLAGLTNAGVEVTVRDVERDESRTYGNDPGSPFPPIQDTSAFATCGAGPALRN